jgi:hypothetical protein
VARRQRLLGFIGFGNSVQDFSDKQMSLHC